VDTTTKTICHPLAQRVIGKEAAQIIKCMRLHFSECVVGTLIEESDFIGFDHGSVFSKMNTPDLPKYHSIHIITVLCK
jgi:hypothetical protein